MRTLMTLFVERAVRDTDRDVDELPTLRKEIEKFIIMALDFAVVNRLFK